MQADMESSPTDLFSTRCVLQICAHEEVIPLEKLYEMCEQAREITKDDKYKLNVLGFLLGFLIMMILDVALG